MRKLVTVFCESFSDKDFIVLGRIVKRLAYKPKFLFVALSPTACYQLEKVNIGYATPEMYCRVPDVKFDPYKEQNNRLRVFQIYKYEKERASIYWKQFLVQYLKVIYGDRRPVILYFGKRTGLRDELRRNKILDQASIRNINMFKQK